MANEITPDRMPAYTFDCTFCEQRVIHGQCELVYDLIPRLDENGDKYWDSVQHNACGPCQREIKQYYEEAQFEIVEIERAEARGLPRPKPKPIVPRPSKRNGGGMDDTIAKEILTAIAGLNTNIQTLSENQNVIVKRLEAVESKPNPKIVEPEYTHVDKAKQQIKAADKKPVKKAPAKPVKPTPKAAKPKTKAKTNARTSGRRR